MADWQLPHHMHHNMADWQGRKANNANDELSTPLLPHGTDDDPETIRAAAAAVSHDTRVIRPGSPQATRGKGQTTRRTSTLSNANKRRRRRNQLSRSRAASIAGNVSARSVLSDVSVTSDDVTARISHLTKATADDDGSDSELSDYEDKDNEGSKSKSNIEKDVPREKMTNTQMATASVVGVLTIGSVGSYLSALLASAALGVSSVAMSTLAVAGGVCVCTVPFVWVSEWRLVHLPTMRKRVRDLQNEAIQFQKNVDNLIMEDTYLREEVESLKEGNERLEQLVTVENRGNVEELIELVHENQIVLREMKDNLRQVVLQDVIKLVLKSDIDHDQVINKKEAGILAARLSISLGIYGIVFDEEKFHRAVGLSPSLAGVMKIVKRILPDENDKLSSFYDTYGGDSDDDDDYDEDDDEFEVEEEDDVYDMFYVPVEDEFNRGNSQSISLCKEFLASTGERPNLMSLSSSLVDSMRGLRVCPDRPPSR